MASKKKKKKQYLEINVVFGISLKSFFFFLLFNLFLLLFMKLIVLFNIINEFHYTIFFKIRCFQQKKFQLNKFFSK